MSGTTQVSSLSVEVLQTTDTTRARVSSLVVEVLAGPAGPTAALVSSLVVEVLAGPEATIAPADHDSGATAIASEWAFAV